MTVKFEKVAQYKNVDFNLPKRKTKFSAGYDFEVPEDIIIPSFLQQVLAMLNEFQNSPQFIQNLLAEPSIVDLLTDFEKNYGITPEQVQEQFEKTGDITELFSSPDSVQFVAQLSQTLLSSYPSLLTLTLQDAQDIIKKAQAKATLVPTGVKAKIEPNQRLELMIRSSIPLKSYLIMGNSIGLIDADYYNNEDNEGHIFFQIINLSPFNIKLKKGDIIGQGVISEYQTTSDDKTTGTRKGGFGSTTEKKGKKKND